MDQVDKYMPRKITPQQKQQLIYIGLAGIVLIFLQSWITASSISSKENSSADYEIARSQSYGMLDGTPASEWALMRQRVLERKNHENPDAVEYPENQGDLFYANNWFPDFTCPHERMIGGFGGEHKWVCNPSKIATVVKNRQDRKWNNGCLVYSFGGGKEFRFEEGLRNALGIKCEIHVFDPTNFAAEAQSKGFVFHPWGLKGYYDVEENIDKRYPGEYKSLKDIVQALGHQGRVIDIMNIDCEGCEWRIYKDWFNTPISITQIIVQTHGFRQRLSNDFFNTLQNQGYVTFHKEPSYGPKGDEFNYGFIKLAPEFFSQSEDVSG